MGGEQGWVQMEALERVQDAGCEDVGLNPALCSAPGGRQGHRGAESSPAVKSSYAGETQYGRCFLEQGVHGEGGAPELLREARIGAGHLHRARKALLGFLLNSLGSSLVKLS